MRWTNLLLYFILYLAAASWSCSTKGVSDDNDNCSVDTSYTSLENVMGQINTTQPTFPGTVKITLSSYSYPLSGTNYTINMQATLPNNDLCDFLQNVNVHATTPRFIVPAINSKLIAFSISTKLPEIRLDKTSIKNVDAIVWTWNSGLNTGKIQSGNLVVEYAEGKRVVKGKISDTTLSPLRPGQLYFFTMWSWDDNGTRISSSSPTVPFMVTSNWYNFTTMAHLSRGLSTSSVRWRLSKAEDITNNLAVSPTLRPDFFNIHFYTCAERSARRLAEALYSEEGIVRQISFNGKFVRVPNSTYFKSQLEIMFSCESRLVLKMVSDGRTILLTYVR